MMTIVSTKEGTEHENKPQRLMWGSSFVIKPDRVLASVLITRHVMPDLHFSFIVLLSVCLSVCWHADADILTAADVPVFLKTDVAVESVLVCRWLITWSQTPTVVFSVLRIINDGFFVKLAGSSSLITQHTNILNLIWFTQGEQDKMKRNPDIMVDLNN